MCKCIEQVNETLKEHNCAVVSSIHLFNPKKPSMVYLQTAILVKKRGAKPIQLMASFCPFCGEKYPD